MIYKQKYRNQICSTIGALLLLLVFLAPVLTEALHHHSCHSREKAVKKIKISDEKHYNSSHSKCKVCELIKHQSDNGSVSQQLPLILSPSVIQTARLANLWKTNLGFTLSSSNKGPPSPSC